MSIPVWTRGGRLGSFFLDKSLHLPSSVSLSMKQRGNHLKISFSSVAIINICVYLQYSIRKAQDMGQKCSHEIIWEHYSVLHACYQDEAASVESQTLNGLALCLGWKHHPWLWQHLKRKLFSECSPKNR